MRVKIALGIVAFFVAVLAAPASGGTPPTFTVTPTTGPPDTNFAVTGDQCFAEEGVDTEGVFIVYAPDSDQVLVAGGDRPLETGVWANTFPADALPGPGTYVVEAVCNVAGELDFEYEPVTITVTEAPPTTPTTEESTTTTAAAPATAAAARPSFTG